MKRLLLILILTLSFQSWTKADDISDFEIEGMSVGDSLLDYFSKEEILNGIVDWYDDLEKNRYVSMAFENSDFKTYEYVDVWTKHGDKNYLIDGIAGSIYFGNNKEFKDIDDCYNKQKEIANDMQGMFESAKKDGPYKLTHPSDPSGKSSYTDIYFILDNEYEATISCYDWSDDIIHKPDHFGIILRSKELTMWLP